MIDIVEDLRATADDTDAVDNPGVADLLEKAAAAIERLRAERRWISVSERLPEPGMPVLCAMPSGSVEVRRKREYAGFWEWWDGDIDEIAVTHWMPLPQPPSKAAP
jgi:hypothetical protein